MQPDHDAHQLSLAGLNVIEEVLVEAGRADADYAEQRAERLFATETSTGGGAVTSPYDWVLFHRRRPVQCGPGAAPPKQPDPVEPAPLPARFPVYAVPGELIQYFYEKEIPDEVVAQMRRLGTAAFPANSADPQSGLDRIASEWHDDARVSDVFVMTREAPLAHDRGMAVLKALPEGSLPEGVPTLYVSYDPPLSIAPAGTTGAVVILTQPVVEERVTVFALSGDPGAEIMKYLDIPQLEVLDRHLPQKLGEEGSQGFNVMGWIRVHDGSLTPDEQYDAVKTQLPDFLASDAAVLRATSTVGGYEDDQLRKWADELAGGVSDEIQVLAVDNELTGHDRGTGIVTASPYSILLVYDLSEDHKYGTRIVSSEKGDA